MISDFDLVRVISFPAELVRLFTCPEEDALTASRGWSLIRSEDEGGDAQLCLNISLLEACGVPVSTDTELVAAECLLLMLFCADARPYFFPPFAGT